MKLNQFFQSALVLVSAILPILAAPSSNELYPMSQLQRNQDADIPAGLDLLAIDVKGLNEFLNNGSNLRPTTQSLSAPVRGSSIASFRLFCDILTALRGCQ
jgi:hypothetical protein